MKYSIKLNAVNNPDKSVKAFAAVTFGDCFKITNIAVVKTQEGEPFVSMPSFKSKERNEHNQPVYKDVCNPITSDFRKELYDDILSLYGEMERSGKSEVNKAEDHPEEPKFRVAVTPFERKGSNIRGLARIYFDDCFVVNNVSIIQGREKEFVAMPSYMAKQNGKDGKPQYQDVCFPVTKEFREKLYEAVLECYMQQSKMIADKINKNIQREISDPVLGNREMPFR